MESEGLSMFDIGNVVSLALGIAVGWFAPNLIARVKAYRAARKQRDA
jgi:hypothetical protein